MLIEVLFLLAGLLLLVKASNITINRAAALSQLSGISQVAIGFIFIAIATSLPELAIGIISSVSGEGILSVGNLIGADIANLALVFGIMCFLGFNIGRIYSVRIEQALILTAGIGLFIIILGQIGIAFGVFCLLLFYLFSSSVMKEGVVTPTEEGIKTIKIVEAAGMLLVSVSLVIISAYIVTTYAIQISMYLGVAESIIGATILAIGTTLPELSVNVSAIRKGNISLAIGDLIGSLVTNLTLILGLVAIINPLTIGYNIVFIAFFMIVTNILFFAMAKRMNFGYKQGIALLGIYATYLILVFMLI